MLTLALALLLGCATHEVRAANRYEAEGRLLEATNVWVAVLETDMDDLRARYRLETVFKDAWAAEVARADAALAAGRPDEALAAWQGLAALRDRLAGVEFAYTPHADEVKKALGGAEEAVAEGHYQAGLTAEADRQWDAAVRAWEAARAVRPEYRDTTPRIAAAMVAQADLDRAAARYPDALARYDAAYALSGNDDAGRWAAAIRAAWGRADLAAGRCRAAFDRLTAAGSVDANVAVDLERARDCARLELVVPAAEELTGAAPTGIAIGGLFSDRLTAELRAHGSAHLRLLDPLAPPPAGTGRRLTVRARITELTVAPTDQTLARSETGRTQVACDSLSSDAFVAGVGYVCDADVIVTWTEHVVAKQARVAGSARWYGADGVELGSTAFEGTGTREVRWAEGYLVNGAPVKRADAPAPGVVVLPGPVPPTSASALDGPDAELFREASAAAAQDAARRTLEALDRAEEGAPPDRLDVRAPTGPGPARSDVRGEPI